MFIGTPCGRESAELKLLLIMCIFLFAIFLCIMFFCMLSGYIGMYIAVMYMQLWRSTESSYPAGGRYCCWHDI